MANTIWDVEGIDSNYEYYRNSSRSLELRQWVDEAYYDKNLKIILDSNFLDQLRNHDFFARLWELELAEWLYLTGLKLIPTDGSGPDFCVELSDCRKVWVEAVLAKPDDAMDNAWRATISPEGELAQVYDFPKDANALRYASSLYTKATKISEKYMAMTSEDSFMLIAISAFPPSSLHPNIEHFMRAALPMGDPVIHISTNGKPIDPSIIRATHTNKIEYVKENGSLVLKQFLYPGTYFPYVDGVLFTEASNLQLLLGTSSTSFCDSTNIPHIFPNHASKKKLPAEFTNNFYLHEFVEDSPLMSLKVIDPKN